MERERSSRKTRDERERDHHRDRDRHGSREEKHRPQEVGPRRERYFGGSSELAKDGKHHDIDRHRQSRDDSPQDLELRGERSYSIERSKEDKHHDKGSHRRSRADTPLRHERSSAEYRDSVERPKDERHRDRHHHSRTDSPHDLEPMRERSSDGFRDSVERGGGSREQSMERHPHSSRKRKVHDGNGDDVDKRGKRTRASEGLRERQRFEDRVMEEADDLNGGYREKRMEEKISKDKKKEIKPTHMERDREEIKVKREEFSDEEDRKVRRERRRFSDNTKVQEKRDEQGLKDMIKDEDSESAEEAKPSLLLGRPTNGGPSNTASEKSGSTANVVSQEPLTLASKVSMTSSASYHPFPTKVSSITTTNENAWVSITRSDEVPGKSSTDGTTNSVAGRSGSLTLDALAKAKKALQIQKELKEKLKKIPMLNKPAITGTDNPSHTALSKDGLKVPVPTTTTTAAKLVVGASTSENSSAAAGVGVVPGLTTIPNIEAVKRAQELAAKMGFRQDPEFAPLINMFPGPSAADVSIPQKPTKAPVLRLDAQGREIDEHGNVINMPKLTNLSTLKVNINKQKKEAFQILGPELDGNTESNPHFDASMGIDKTKLLRPKRMSFQFVEEGRWSKQAEIIKFKSQFGEAQAKELKLKQSQLAKAKAEVDNPNLIELPDRFDRIPRDKKKDDIPDIEWWDKPFLPSGGYIDVTGDGLNFEKITIYVEHPRPIEPPADPAPPPPQPLKLTKKEQKKLRTQRRLAKERDRQEMIRQGLLEPPKPKVKMSNLMKVLGSEATQDPTRLEMEIRSAAAEREQAHVDRNIARKLTPAERREKKERKLFEDPNTLETIVSVYKINDLSHPQTRFKVDVNAQENRLSGVAVISDGITVVVVEGGKKSIKRYGKLMLKRINWASAVNEEEGAENADTPVNSCVLVWQGSVAKSSFYRFIIHQCRTEAAARKVFADAGVPHYWDLAINFSEELL